MSRIDVYTPWRDPAGAAERHVGRGDELDGIVGAARAHLSGSAQNWVYVFGPRGVGKSHLLTLVRARLEAEHPDLPLDILPEDIPALRSAAALIDRIDDGRPTLPWLAAPTARRTDGWRRRVVFIEGLDRHLAAMDRGQRRELRRLLDERPGWWIVATGVGLPTHLTQREEAFFQHFNPWPLAPLDPEDSKRLLDAMVLASDSPSPPGWEARRDTLVTLAGGNPRALMALGAACREEPRRWASRQLESVVQDFTAHYQMRFRDLAPQQQEIVELLSLAHRELTPTIVGQHLTLDSATAAVQLQRLADAGVVGKRSDGRQSFYALTEPLFGYWLEYRNGAWDQTLAGWLTRLLETLLSPPELARLWFEGGDPEMQAAAARALVPGSPQHSMAWQHLLEMSGRTPKQAAARAIELSPEPIMLRALLVTVLVWNRDEDAVDSLRRHVRALGDDWGDVAALLSFEEALRRKKSGVRSAFRALLRGLDSYVAPGEHQRVGTSWFVRDAVVQLLEMYLRRGRPWKLDVEEQRTLGRIPHLRATYLARGRLASHPPLLDMRYLPDAPIGGDAAEILAGALARHDLSLAERTVARMTATDFDTKPAHPPARLGPRVAEQIADALGRGSNPGVGWMAWISVGVDCSERAFERMLHVSRVAQVFPYGTDAAELALSWLGHARPDRLERLAATLRPGWQRHVEAARRLVKLMSNRDGSRLSAPLEQLRLALTEEPADRPSAPTTDGA